MEINCYICYLGLPPPASDGCPWTRWLDRSKTLDAEIMWKVFVPTDGNQTLILSSIAGVNIEWRIQSINKHTISNHWRFSTVLNVHTYSLISEQLPQCIYIFADYWLAFISRHYVILVQTIFFLNILRVGSIIFWDINPCSTLKVSQRFGETYFPLLQGRISQIIIDIYLLLRVRSIIFWDKNPCSPLKVSRRFEETYFPLLQGRISQAWKYVASRALVSCSIYASTLKMVLICSSETLAGFQQTTRRHISEVGTLFNHRCHNLKSYITLTNFRLQRIKQEGAHGSRLRYCATGRKVSGSIPD
jgi:hypothetical protein